MKSQNGWTQPRQNKDFVDRICARNVRNGSDSDHSRMSARGGKRTFPENPKRRKLVVRFLPKTKEFERTIPSPPLPHAVHDLAIGRKGPVVSCWFFRNEERDLVTHP